MTAYIGTRDGAHAGSGAGESDRQSVGAFVRRSDGLYAFIYLRAQPVTYRVGGVPTTDIANAGAVTVWGGAPTDGIDLSQRWVTFMLRGGGAVYATPEANQDALVSAQEAVMLDYLTGGEGWRAWQPTFRPCLPLSPRMQIQAGALSSGDAVGDDAAVRFSTPGAMAVSPLDGALYVVDGGNHKIKRRDATTFLWSEVLTDAEITATSVIGGGGVTLGSTIAVAADGTLYYTTTTVVSFQNFAAIKAVAAGSPPGTVGTRVLGKLTFPPDNPPCAALNAGGPLNSGIALSRDQALIYYYRGSQVYAYSRAGATVAVAAGTGQTIDTRTGTDATYLDPTANSHWLTAIVPGQGDLCADPSGNVYGLSALFCGVQRFNADNTVTPYTYSGTFYHIGDVGLFNSGPSYTLDGQLAATANIRGDGHWNGPFDTPSALDISDCFDLVVADTNNLVVRTIGPDTVVHTLAGGPRDNNAGTGGSGATLASPILGLGATADAHAYGIPGFPTGLRSRPRAQGGGVWVSLAGASANGTAHAILLIA